MQDRSRLGQIGGCILKGKVWDSIKLEGSTTVIIDSSTDIRRNNCQKMDVVTIWWLLIQMHWYTTKQEDSYGNKYMILSDLWGQSLYKILLKYQERHKSSIIITIHMDGSIFAIIAVIIIFSKKNVCGSFY